MDKLHMPSKTADWMKEFEVYLNERPRRHGGGSFDTVRYMEVLPDWNCLPLGNFSPDLINDPSNMVAHPIEP